MKKIVTIHKTVTANGFRYPLANVIDISIENTGLVVATIFEGKAIPVGGTIEDNYPNGVDPLTCPRSGDLLIKFAGGVSGEVSLLMHVWAS